MLVPLVLFSLFGNDLSFHIVKITTFQYMKCMPLIRYVRSGVSWHDDLDIGLLLTRKLENQEFPVVNIKYQLKRLTMVIISRSTVTDSLCQR